MWQPCCECTMSGSGDEKLHFLFIFFTPLTPAFKASGSTQYMASCTRYRGTLRFQIFPSFFCIALLSSRARGLSNLTLNVFSHFQLIQFCQNNKFQTLSIFDSISLFCIYCNNCPRFLLNFEAVRCGANWREALISKLGK